MPNGYPTPEQILAEPAVTFRRGVIPTVRDWKRAHRGMRRTPEAIRDLLMRLADLYGQTVLVRFSDGEADRAYPGLGIIVLNREHLSVVTALHEFAHLVYGRSELTACRWSVALFRRTFPRTFQRARFDGHMLRIR